MGADAWRPHHTKALAGGNVIIVADDDEAGHRHAQHVYSELQAVTDQVALWLPAEGCKDLSDPSPPATGSTSCAAWRNRRPVCADTC